MNKPKIYNFIVRLDAETYESLSKLADFTHRTKAQATRAAIIIAYQLFVGGNSLDLEKQVHKEIVSE